MLFSGLFKKLLDKYVPLSLVLLKTLESNSSVAYVKVASFRIVKPWNCLPAELHNFSSLSIFKYFVFSTDLSDFVTC